MGSYKDRLMVIANGVMISASSTEKSRAFAMGDWFHYPQNTGNLEIKNLHGLNSFNFAGGNNDKFGLVEIEVWGLK